MTSGASPEVENSQRRALAIALALNAALALGLGAAGLLADSSALIANALDNASDTAVYAISLLAVSRGPRWKARAAQLSGVLLVAFAAGVLIDVARRFLAGAEPLGPAMMAMALVAAAVNYACVRILRGHRKQNVNLRAAWIFSLNDLVSNIGVLIAGALVMWLASPWPDLVAGFAIAAIAVKGAFEILEQARKSALAGRS